MNKKDWLLNYATMFIGVPYVWGGDSPQGGFDCSGYVQECLRSVGLDPPGDQTAQALHDWLLNCLCEPMVAGGALMFYGKDNKSITHVAIALNESQLIEAGGGNSLNIDLNASIKHGGFVRIRPVGHRKDFVIALMPIY